MVKILIIDDEIMAVRTLSAMIRMYIDVPYEIESETDFHKAISLAQSFTPDLLFLDVVMPPRTGFDLLAALHPRNFKVIFTTAFDTYAIQAIRYSALDYLLKPISAEDLKMAFARFRASGPEDVSGESYSHLLSNLETRAPHLFTLAIPTLEKTYYVPPADLIRCESESNYTWFYLTNGEKILSSKTLKAYESLLSDEGFVRVHRSHLINRNHILRAEKDDILVLKNGDRIPLSRSKRLPFRSSMKDM